MRLALPADDVLRASTTPATAVEIGVSREGRGLVGYRFGQGSRHVSLIAGCHADEPVGPAMLDRLVAYLATLDTRHPLLRDLRWWIVPHANPDGEARNAAWTSATRESDGGTVYDLPRYLHGVVRERPGDDVEFGFPRDEDDDAARPENRAVAAFLRDGAPFALHGSFHGMAFAAGPWFLVEASWADDRTAAMRQRLRERVAALGYRVHDIDRGGDKGFHRIDEGFTTRPDSRAMQAHFEARGDAETARRFRPSSMEYVRSLGGDPLTLVSEMPLFLLPKQYYREGDVVRPPVLARLHAAPDEDGLRREAQAVGIEAMPIEDQMRLQLAFLEEGLAAAVTR